MSQVKPIKTALIGSGSISNRYLNNMKKFQILDIIGCSDIIPERSAEKAEKFGIRQMTNEEILNDEEIKIVVNTTYPTAHYEVSKAALLANKNVYSEKMIAVELEEGRELVELAKKKGLLMTMAPDTFLGGGWQTARMLLDSGYIGEVVSIVGVCARNYQLTGENSQSFAFVMQPGGGIPFDMGGYYLHNMINLVGPINRVSGFVKTRNQNRSYLNPHNPHYKEDFFLNTPNMLSGSLEFKCGVYGSLTVVSECGAGRSGIEVLGTEGNLICHDPNDFSGQILLQRFDSAPMPIPLTHGFKEEFRGLGVADMAYALKNNRAPRAHVEMGFHVFEAVHGIWNSCKTGEVYQMTSTCMQPKPLRPSTFGGSMQEAVLDD